MSGFHVYHIIDNLHLDLRLGSLSIDTQLRDQDYHVTGVNIFDRGRWASVKESLDLLRQHRFLNKSEEAELTKRLVDDVKQVLGGIGWK